MSEQPIDRARRILAAALVEEVPPYRVPPRFVAGIRDVGKVAFVGARVADGEGPHATIVLAQADVTFTWALTVNPADVLWCRRKGLRRRGR